MTPTQSPAPPHAALEERVREWASAHIPESRQEHVSGVVETVTGLAQHYAPAALPSLRLAAWIHDAAKAHTDDELLHLADAYSHKIRKVERLCPQLLHGVVAALMARADLGLDDPPVFSASAYHTTGHPKMSLADKLLYVADAVEPGRQYSWAQQASDLADNDLDQALLFILTKQLRRLLKRTAIIDPRSIRLRNRLLAEGVPLVI